MQHEIYFNDQSLLARHRWVQCWMYVNLSCGPGCRKVKPEGVLISSNGHHPAIKHLQVDGVNGTYLTIYSHTRVFYFFIYYTIAIVTHKAL